MMSSLDPGCSFCSSAAGLTTTSLRGESQLLLRSLKSCEKLIASPRQLHADALLKGVFPSDVRVVSALIHTYFKCGAITDAHHAFQHLITRDVVAWSTLISGYAHHGLIQDALLCFTLMQQESISPDAVTFVGILKACITTGPTALALGQEIHAQVQKLGLLKNNFVLANAVFCMYAKCGKLEKAQCIFDELSYRDVVSWNTLITAYCQQRHDAQAFECFRRMQVEGILPDAVTILCILKACATTGSLKLGEEIHAELCNQRFSVKQTGVIGTALMDMYAKCGQMGKAKQVFDNLPLLDVVACNALMLGYLQHGLMDDILKCFRQMQDENISPDGVTFLCALRACSSIGALEVGEEIHQKINKHRQLENDMFIGTTLVDMYAKCGALGKARLVFDKLPVRDAVTWNVCIAGYVKCGCLDEAVNCFLKMQDEGISPDTLTFSLISKGCSSGGSLKIAKMIHAQVYKLGILDRDLVLCTCLVDLYSKCGALERAKQVLDELRIRDVVVWNALIAGYAEYGLGHEASTCFWQMQEECICPDMITFTSILKACGNMGSLRTGIETHVRISEGLVSDEDAMVGSALVEMYAKCGLLTKARDVFEELSIQNVAAWNALITGAAQLGRTKEIAYLFREMVVEQINPDNVTFAALLTGCSHAGLVEEAQFVFDEMQTLFYLIPNLKHYTCMIDLLGRAGHFSKAMTVLGSSLSIEQLPLLLVFLGACQKWANMELGKWAFEKSLELDEKCEVAYICMQNISAMAPMHADNG